MKFLVGRDGVPIKRFGSLYNPKDFEGDVSDSQCFLLHDARIAFQEKDVLGEDSFVLDPLCINKAICYTEDL